MDKIDSTDPRLIPGFCSLTKQEAFDISARHLMSTKKPAINDTGTCIYGGTGCGAAPFLKEECREKARGSWSSVVNESHLQKFICALQAAHDNAAAQENQRANYDKTKFKNEAWFQSWRQLMFMIANAADLDTHTLYTFS